MDALEASCSKLQEVEAVRKQAEDDRARIQAHVAGLLSFLPGVATPLIPDFAGSQPPSTSIAATPSPDLAAPSDTSRDEALGPDPSDMSTVVEAGSGDKRRRESKNAGGSKPKRGRTSSPGSPRRGGARGLTGSSDDDLGDGVELLMSARSGNEPPASISPGGPPSDRSAAGSLSVTEPTGTGVAIYDPASDCSVSEAPRPAVNRLLSRARMARLPSTSLSRDQWIPGYHSLSFLRLRLPLLGPRWPSGV